MSSSNEEDIKQFLHAAKEGDKKKIQSLLSKGILINAHDPADSEKATALHLAIEKDHYEIVELLLKHHAKLNQPKENKNGSFPLHLAASHGHTKIVQTLLAYGADIDQADKAGMTALHLAVISNHLPIVTLLLLNGADICKKNLFGTPPLQTAALKKNKNILKILTAYSSFVFCLEEKYIDFLARLMGSSIKEDYDLNEQINAMIPVKVTMLWEQNEEEIKKNLRSFLPQELDIRPYLNYTKNFLLQCVIKRLYNKILSNLHDLSEHDSDSTPPKTNITQFDSPLKNNDIKPSTEVQMLVKKMNSLQKKMLAHAEKLEFEEATKVRDEITGIKTALKNMQLNNTPSVDKKESDSIEYGGVLGQMKVQGNLGDTENKSIQLRNKLYLHAQKLEFEEAARLRDEIIKFEEDFFK